MSGFDSEMLEAALSLRNAAVENMRYATKPQAMKVLKKLGIKSPIQDEETTRSIVKALLEDGVEEKHISVSSSCYYSNFETWYHKPGKRISDGERVKVWLNGIISELIQEEEEEREEEDKIIEQAREILRKRMEKGDKEAEEDLKDLEELEEI